MALKQGDMLPSDHVFAGLRYHHYRCVYADPPTKFVAGVKSRPQHYKRMTDAEIAAMPVADLLHPDGCWLFLWVTSPKLYPPPRSRQLLSPADLARGWGFARYSARAFLWIKQHKSLADKPPQLFHHRDSLHRGMGYTTAKNAEDCLLFRVGMPVRRSAKVHEIIIAPRRDHSRKPDETIERIQQFCAGPYVELFSRQPRPGWDSFGNEVTKFSPQVAA